MTQQQKQEIQASDLLEVKVPLAVSLKGVMIVVSLFISFFTIWTTLQTRLNESEMKIVSLQSQMEQHQKAVERLIQLYGEVDKKVDIHIASTESRKNN